MNLEDVFTKEEQQFLNNIFTNKPIVKKTTTKNG